MPKLFRGTCPWVVCLALTLPLGAADPPVAKDKDAWKPLFDGKSLAGWKASDFRGGGKVEVKDGAIVMDKGASMSGLAYSGKDFPKVDYEVSFEGKRVAGDDFFCTTIFPSATISARSSSAAGAARLSASQTSIPKTLRPTSRRRPGI